MDLIRLILSPLGIILINGLMARCMPTDLNTSGLSNSNNETNKLINLSQAEEKKNNSILYVYPESSNKQAKNIIFVYPDKNASAYLANLFNMDNKNASTNLNISSSAKYKNEDIDTLNITIDFIDQNMTTVVSESDQRSNINETVETTDIRPRDRLFQLSKMRYERRHKFKPKIKDNPMEIINETIRPNETYTNETQIVSDGTDVQDDQAMRNDSDLLEAESNEYDNFALILPPNQDVVNASFNNLDIIPFTFDDAVKPLDSDDESATKSNLPLDYSYVRTPEMEENNKPIKTKPIKKYKGDNLKKDHLYRTWKDDAVFPKTYQLGQQQNVSAANIENLSINQPVSMWSGYLAHGEPMLPMPLFQRNVETYSRSSDNGILLIIGPIPKKLSPLFDKKYEPFKDQLQLPNV